MTRRPSRDTTGASLPPSLIIPATELESQIDKLLERGRALLQASNSVEAIELDENRWAQFGQEVLRRAFTTDQYEQELRRSGGFGTTNEEPRERFEMVRERMAHRMNVLVSIRERLELLGSSERQTNTTASHANVNTCLHPTVAHRCGALFESEHYAEAVEASFKVVRDRLRLLTGHERGSEAFGKGKLHIKGAIAAHVDKDFNDGVKFLTMAIDMFRNEKSHTSEIGIDEPTKALQYLILSSLAMRLLDSAEINQ